MASAKRSRTAFVVQRFVFRHELPNIPVDGITVRLRLPQRVKLVRVLPAGRSLRLRGEGDTVVFAAPRLETLLMLAVNHAQSP